MKICWSLRTALTTELEGSPHISIWVLTKSKAIIKHHQPDHRWRSINAIVFNKNINMGIHYGEQTCNFCDLSSRQTEMEVIQSKILKMIESSTTSLNSTVKDPGKFWWLFQPQKLTWGLQFWRRSCQFNEIILSYAVMQASENLCRNMTLDVQEPPEPSFFTAPEDLQCVSTVNTTHF